MDLDGNAEVYGLGSPADTRRIDGVPKQVERAQRFRTHQHRSRTLPRAAKQGRRSLHRVGWARWLLHRRRPLRHRDGLTNTEVTDRKQWRRGHATPNVALRYQHTTLERDRSIAEKLDALMLAHKRPIRRRR